MSGGKGGDYSDEETQKIILQLNRKINDLEIEILGLKENIAERDEQLKQLLDENEALVSKYVSNI